MLFQENYIGCNVVHDVVDPRLNTFVQQSALQLVQPNARRSASFRFPGPMPITVERCHVNRIKAGGFAMTPKADGLRVLVLFLRYFIDDARQPLCVLLHRGGACQLIMQHTNLAVYDNGGSVFDAELVTLRDQQTVQLYLFDCYAYKGTCVTTATLDRRQNVISRLIDMTDSAHPNVIQMQLKPFVPFVKGHLADAQSFITNTHALPFPTDGVVLVSSGPITKFGTSDEQFKLKAYHTVDLIIVDDEGDLYLASLDEADDSYVTKQELAQMPEGATINSVLECDVQIADGFASYTPRMIRIDKKLPNSEHVIERTLQTIRDNILLEELAAK